MVRVYQYGCLWPTKNENVVREQMLLAHRYRNALVEIERARRAAVREAELAFGDLNDLRSKVDQAEAKLDSARKALKLERAIRRNKKDTDDAKLRVDTARIALKQARDAWHECRQAVRENVELQAQRDRLSDEAAAKVRAARAASGVYWGTYLLIEAEMQASKAMPLYDGAKPNDPRFVRWTGEGHCAVQIQGGIPVESMMDGSDNRVRLQMIGDRKRAILSLRVGSDEHKDPIWAQVPCIVHRPIPEKSTIKGVVLSLRKIGPREVWTCEITAHVPDQEPTHEPTHGVGTVAIDIGWRAMSGGNYRVATMYDGERTWTTELDAKWISRLEKAEDLRSIRDKNLDAIRARLVSWLKAAVVPIPAWMPANIWQWKAQARLAALVRRWKQQRFDGDAEIFEELEAWRYHDYHLWQWESDQRAKTLRNRKEQYRDLGAKLARAYDTVVFEKRFLKAFSTKGDDSSSKDDAIRSNKFKASLSECCDAVANAFRARGGTVLRVPFERTTMQCWSCGAICQVGEKLEHTCEACGIAWDQDYNAAVNLWRLGRKDENGNESAEVKESKWARAARMKREKDARKTPARETPCNEPL